jgi:deoxyribodipyrimidine photolyase
MPDTAIVWFRRDLRVADLPALAHACREHERVVPLFVFDPTLLAGRFRSAGRTAWLLECLAGLDAELRLRGPAWRCATDPRRTRCRKWPARPVPRPCTSQMT